jgi:hypothetical protein
MTNGSALIVAALGLCSNAAWGQTTVDQPPFIEAAIFFLTGREGQALRYESENRVVISLNDINMANVTYFVRPETPCILYELEPAPSTKLSRFEFDRLPHPSDFTIGTDWVKTDLLPETHCWNPRRRKADGKLELVPDATKCSTTLLIPGGVRRLNALQYIRDRFCSGLPEKPKRLRPY